MQLMFRSHDDFGFKGYWTDYFFAALAFELAFGCKHLLSLFDLVLETGTAGETHAFIGFRVFLGRLKHLRISCI